MGHWDEEEKICNRSNKKMYNLNLRKAILVITNYELITENLYGGLRTRANSIIPPVFENLYTMKLDLHTIRKSKRILDEAGYKK